MDWSVEIVETLDNGNYGEFDPATQTISIATHTPRSGKNIALTDEQIRNTFWHEIFHLFNWLWNTGDDEGLAQSFANFMREYECTSQFE